MQLSFRLDKRPGESHLALDGKKMCTANAFFCCLSAATIKNACFTLLGSNQFVWCIILSCDTVALYHCVHGKSLFVVVFVGPCPFAFCFASLLDGETHIWLGGSAFRPFVWLFLCFRSVFDLPCYMTTVVNVDFISNFFTCKDRALERDRPYQRKKKSVVARCEFCEQSRLRSLQGDLHVAGVIWKGRRWRFEDRRRACAKQISFRRDPKVDPFRIESGPCSQACFWFNTNSIRGRNLELGGRICVSNFS